MHGLSGPVAEEGAEPPAGLDPEPRPDAPAAARLAAGPQLQLRRHGGHRQVQLVQVLGRRRHLAAPGQLTSAAGAGQVRSSTGPVPTWLERVRSGYARLWASTRAGQDEMLCWKRRGGVGVGLRIHSCLQIPAQALSLVQQDRFVRQHRHRACQVI